MTTANGGRFQLHSRPLSYNSNILPDYFTPNHSTKAQSYGIRRYFQSARRRRREELELNRDETPHLQTYQAHAAWTSDHESVFPQLVQPNDTQHKQRVDMSGIAAENYFKQWALTEHSLSCPRHNHSCPTTRHQTLSQEQRPAIYCKQTATVHSVQ